MPELTTLDERLAEIDARLRSLQDGLEEPAPDAVGPVSASSPVGPTSLPAAPARPSVMAPALQPVPAPAPAESGHLVAQLRELADAQERLLELHRDLLSEYAGLLERRAAETLSASVVAGPFADHQALRDFARELERLPGVTGVTAREFLSGDRVTLDVRVAAR